MQDYTETAAFEDSFPDEDAEPIHPFEKLAEEGMLPKEDAGEDTVQEIVQEPARGPSEAARTATPEAMKAAGTRIKARAYTKKEMAELAGLPYGRPTHEIESELVRKVAIGKVELSESKAQQARAAAKELSAKDPAKPDPTSDLKLTVLLRHRGHDTFRAEILYGGPMGRDPELKVVEVASVQEALDEVPAVVAAAEERWSANPHYPKAPVAKPPAPAVPVPTAPKPSSEARSGKPGQVVDPQRAAAKAAETPAADGNQMQLGLF